MPNDPASYYGVNYTEDIVFCVNPGQDVQNLPDAGVPGNGIGEANEPVPWV